MQLHMLLRREKKKTREMAKSCSCSTQQTDPYIRMYTDDPVALLHSFICLVIVNGVVCSVGGAVVAAAWFMPPTGLR